MNAVRMQPSHRWLVVLFLTLSALQVAGCARSTGGTSAKVEPAHVEPIEGTEFSRVVLTEKAAERLDIQTAVVREEQTSRKLTAGGQVIAASDSSGPVAASADTGVAARGVTGAMLVRVSLSENELNSVDRSQPAIVEFLDDEEDSDDETAGLAAEPDEGLADDDRDEDALYYAVPSTDRPLAPGQRVLVELSLSGDNTPRKVVPYSAVLYGVNGETWVYTRPEALVFVRQPITVDYVEDDLAILSEGPETGTAVVTVGAAELFGAETGVSK